MIDITWQQEREMAPIYVMGRVDPLAFSRGRRRDTITIEVTDEDGEGTIVMTDEQQLYRLYEKLREHYHPQTIAVPPVENPRPDVVDIPVQPYFTRTFEVNMPTNLPMEYVPATPINTTGQVFTREALEEAMRTIEETPIQPTQYILTEDQMNLLRATQEEINEVRVEDVLTPRQIERENYYERTRPRRHNAYVPGTYTNLNYGPRQPARPIDITFEVSIADDPADQESILQFMEKE